MEIYQLRYFLAAAETGSFTKAAERVHVSQPTLSAGIKKLEQGLGIDLFERRARRTFLSAAGLRFLDRARTIIAECNLARHELAADQTRQKLRLGCLPTIPAPRLAALLADFTKAFPAIGLDVREAAANRLNDWLDQDRIDAAITLLRDDEAGLDTLDHQPLYRERMVLAFATDHNFATRQSLQISDLNSTSYIYRSHCPQARGMAKLVAAQGVRPHVACRTSQDERALALVASGLGVSMVPDTFVCPGVALAPLADLTVQSDVALVWPKDKSNDIVHRFKSFAASHDWKSRPPDNIGDGRLKWAR